jgi:hypothetical protein
MERLSIYLQINFLVTFFELLKKSMLHLEQAEEVLFVQKLIRKSGSIYVDLNSETISQLMNSTNNTKNTYSDDFIFYFKQIGSFVQILECPVKLNDPQDLLLLKNKSKLPHYLMLDCNLTRAVEYEKKLGIICIPKTLQIKKEVYSYTTKPIYKDKKIHLGSYTGNISQSHSIIIEDPYVHIVSQGFLKELLLSFYDVRFKNEPLHILILGQNHILINKHIKSEEKEKFINASKKLKQFIVDFNTEYGNKIIVELVLVENSKLHDRHILANSFWIVSGHSFKEIYNTNTEWQFRPVGIYFQQFKERLDFINTTLERDTLVKMKKDSTGKSYDLNNYNTLLR